MDGAFVGGRREGQGVGLAAGCEPLVTLRDSSADKITRLGDM